MARRDRLIPWLKAGVWLSALLPLAILAYRIVGGSFLADDPVEEIQHWTGLAALILLLITLSVTPLRRLTHWNPLIRFRRLFGLFAFLYATLHAFSYFVFDQQLDPVAIGADVLEHPWVLVGFSAFVLLIPLALTSTRGWIRRLGGARWNRLHRLIYPIAILAVLHFYWLVKKDVSGPVTYGVILVVILGTRLVTGRAVRAVRADRTVGTESTVDASP